MTLQTPWKPMGEAPRDGSLIVVVNNDFSFSEVVVWGPIKTPLCGCGWLIVTDPRDGSSIYDKWNPQTSKWEIKWDYTQLATLHDWYGWVPMPKKPAP